MTEKTTEHKPYLYSDIDEERGTVQVLENDHHVISSMEIEKNSRTENMNLINCDSNNTIKRHFGSHLPFCFVNNEPMFTIGPHCNYTLLFSLVIFFMIGPFFLCMWTGLIIVGILVNTNLSDKTSPEIKAFGIFATIWEAMIYLLTALKNPGIATSQDPENRIDAFHKNDPNFCNPCNIIREASTYHCLDCDVCIKSYDHHCPWTGKCIGAGNIKFFYTFLMSTIIYLVTGIILVVNNL